MIDIVKIGTGPLADIGLYDSDVERAKNIFSIQIGELEYIPTFGIDLKYFLSEDFQFQDESFKSYLMQRLTDYNVNVSDVATLVSDLFQKWTFSIGNQGPNDGLVAR